MAYSLPNRQDIDFKELIFNGVYSDVGLRLSLIVVPMSTSRVIFSNV
jgi:hypothetical protein